MSQQIADLVEGEKAGLAEARGGQGHHQATQGPTNTVSGTAGVGAEGDVPAPVTPLIGLVVPEKR